MLKIITAALGLALLTLPQPHASAYPAGLMLQQADISAAKRRTAKKPKFSRAHCAKLNQEKARLYGICGY